MVTSLLISFCVGTLADPPAAVAANTADVEEALVYALDKLPPAVTVKVFTGEVEPDGSHVYREALATPPDGESAGTTVSFTEAGPAIGLVAAAAVLAAHNPVRAAGVESTFRDGADAPADLRGLKVFNIRLSVVGVTAREPDEGGGTVLRVRPSYFLKSDQPRRRGHAAARDGEAEVWLVKDGKLTLLNGDVKLKPFLFL